jgi:SAM-dependent methyltransferase
MNDKVDFDQYADDYNKLLKKETQFFSSSEEYFAQYKVRLVKSSVHKPVKRILEFGCGIGRNIRHLETFYPDAEIIGTDVSAASLEIAAKENPNAKFHLEQDDLDIGKFDLIFIAGVFHHIAPSERTSVSHVLHKRLSDSGSLCIFEHNPYNPVTRRIVNNCPYDADAVLLKPLELKQLIEAAGIPVQDYHYCLFIPPRFSSLLWIEKFITWLPLGGQYWVSAGFR